MSLRHHIHIKPGPNYYHTHNEDGKVGEVSAFTDKVSGANYSGGAAVSDPIVNEEVP